MLNDESKWCIIKEREYFCLDVSYCVVSATQIVALFFTSF